MFLTMTQKQVLAEIEHPRTPRYFGEHPSFGNQDQITALRIMNSDNAYCPICLDLAWRGVEQVGHACGNCHRGLYVPGAKLETEWRRREGIEDD